MLVENETLPLKLPAAVGANVTLKAAVPPGCKVSGKARLLVVKLAPLNAACVMLTSVAPLLERVTLLVLFAPTLTFPKLSDEGFSESCPGATPSPVTVMEATN